MSKIQKFLENNTPFAVMQYFESLKGNKKETHKKYEFIYLNSKKELSFKLLDKNEVSFVKENTDKIKMIISTAEGQIYDFNNFKEYKTTNCVNK